MNIASHDLPKDATHRSQALSGHSKGGTMTSNGHREAQLMKILLLAFAFSALGGAAYAVCLFC
jgi:hypothetical protein